mmetsp:Transcript_2925/g.8966  ORF Transcript_2925/g.8966 Transcript_2925/m.8966 type:complete len:531 (-) Transcript_2925:1174-2766(-)|eukprot:CAMPEP_0198735660 /NCGR_PEP_ID=MMETSP1475-20131203/61164_1 /TAXON_ID= ORGANISM="Unidentified sp., Strain CCMP1999" /NCGR_SAMPLE_ID=MMETSP1475 /ASSEMBLY_ACC=CAM_ASM_001111 /LENGTH=530 /DNA_ID=CAMNT_0044499357 /DNA_START=349 /DNA_END=1941 /DNA_ORIENTATION=-
MTNVRVLVVGGATDVKLLHKKVEPVARKNGPFNFVCVAGEIGATTSAEIGDVRFPAPTYFASQSFNEDTQPVDLEHNNLYYVGDAAQKTIDGLNLVLLSANYDDPKLASSTTAQSYPFPPEVDTALRMSGAKGAGFQGIDLFVSGDRPRGLIEAGDDGILPGSGLTAAVAILLRPRYHICGGEPHTHVSLGPFVIPGSSHATRTISLGLITPKEGAGKQKPLYAAVMKPLKTMDEADLEKDAPQSNVYRIHPKLASVDANKDAPTGGYFFQMPSEPLRKKRRGDGVEEGKRRPRFEGHPTDAKCWFCLSNEKDLHLVVTVGTDVFLTLAKGGLTSNHVLLMPIAHVRSTMELGDAAYKEIESFKSALREYFDKELNANTLFFERVVNPRGGVLHSHTQIQAVPVPREATESASEVLGVDAERAKLKLRQLPKNTSWQEYVQAQSERDKPEYFYIELPDGREAVQLISEDRKSIDDDRPPHPMQFGRRFAANLLKMPRRADWKTCTKSIEREEEDTNSFRARFSPYDPTKA